MKLALKVLKENKARLVLKALKVSKVLPALKVLAVKMAKTVLHLNLKSVKTISGTFPMIRAHLGLLSELRLPAKMVSKAK